MSNDISALKKLTNKNPKDTASLGLLAEAYQHKGNISSAIKTYEQLLKIEPDNYQALNNYGTILRIAGDTHLSIRALIKANNIFTDSPIILSNLADTYCDMGRFDLAVMCSQGAVKIDPNFFDAHKTLGAAKRSSGKYEEAIVSYTKALKIQPDNMEVIVSLARSYHLSNKNEKAYETIKPHLKTNKPEVLASYFSFSKKLGLRDDAVKRIQAVIKKSNKKATSNSTFPTHYFNLGKHFNETCDYDEAISYYKTGNNLSNRSFSINTTKEYIDNTIATFSKQSYDKNAITATNRSTKPIFILGMPRSGTSLVEQILSSHPDVFGAGELNNIYIAIDQFKTEKKHDGGFFATLKNSTTEEMDQLAEEYLQYITTVSNGEKKVTDKMPHNFMHIGMIMSLFPSATIIHCNRHPLDTCLSGFFANYGNIGHDYAYNLNDIGKYYLEYQRLMKHWEDCFGDKIYQIKYEDLITDHENTSKALVKHCQLEWNDSCLEFHNNQRYVITCSYDQVNKPLYSSSMYRWKHYDKHLTKLKTILADIVDNY
jgi:tetratricopeptide (TPR) repeat protein